MKIVSSESLHDGWPPVARHLVQFEDGRQRDWVAFDFPDGVAVLALTPSRKLILTRQHLMGVDEPSHMLPGGAIHDGETIEAAARRELLEETGHGAGSLEYLFRYVNLPSYSRGWVHLFLALDAAPQSDAARPIEIDGIDLFDIDEAAAIALRGGFAASSVTMAVLLLHRLAAERGLA